jgi:hypothetical protein
MPGVIKAQCLKERCIKWRLTHKYTLPISQLQVAETWWCMERKCANKVVRSNGYCINIKSEGDRNAGMLEVDSGQAPQILFR